MMVLVPYQTELEKGYIFTFYHGTKPYPSAMLSNEENTIFCQFLKKKQN